MTRASVVPAGLEGASLRGERETLAEQFALQAELGMARLVDATTRIENATRGGGSPDPSDVRLVSELRTKFLTREEPDAVLAFFQGVTHACFDVDGTVTKEGRTSLPGETIEAFRLLQATGVEITLGPTGKPLAEIRPLLESIPADVRVGVIYEKGSFRLDEHGVPQPLLMSNDERIAMDVLSDRFYGDKRNLDGEFGFIPIARVIRKEFGVEIVPAGSGEHTNLSFDVLRGGVRTDWWNFTHEDRKNFKLTAETHGAMFREIEFALRRRIDGFIDEHSGRVRQLATIKGFRYVDLDQGNIEITAPSVEKDRAIEAYLMQSPGAKVVVVGDSKNDTAMLSLNRHPNIHSCLVLHGPQAKPLITLVNSAVLGEANAARLIHTVVAAKRAGSIPQL